MSPAVPVNAEEASKDKQRKVEGRKIALGAIMQDVTGQTRTAGISIFIFSFDICIAATKRMLTITARRQQLFGNYTAIAKKYGHFHGEIDGRDHTILKYTGRSGL